MRNTNLMYALVAGLASVGRIDALRTAIKKLDRPPGVSKYTPHQGAKERARRVRQGVNYGY